MSNIKWIKLSTNMFEDEKIRLIEQMPDADTILIIWVKLLAQAGKTNASGYIYLSENIPYTEEMLSAIFNRPISTVRLALKTFVDFGMISIDENNYIAIENWEKHQNVDALEKIRKQTRERVARHREKQKLENQTKTLHVTQENEKESHSNNNEAECNVTVIESNATEEERRKKNKNKKENKDSPSSISKVQEIYNHYLSKNIVRHKKITSDMRSAINARLKDYSYEQLIQVIDNYSIVYHSDDYWFDTKYTLADLMRPKDVRKFIDDADPLNNFKNKPKFGGNTNNYKPQKTEVLPDWFTEQKQQAEQQSQLEQVDQDEEAKMLALLAQHAKE